MLLKEWLAREKIRPYVFAKNIGMSPATIYKNLSGQHRMSPGNAVLIEAKTKGAVSRLECMWPEHFIEIDKNGVEQRLMMPKIQT